MKRMIASAVLATALVANSAHAFDVKGYSGGGKTDIKIYFTIFTW